MVATGRGSGDCSITEESGRWCTIAYAGNTGSLGPLSFGPNSQTAFSNLSLPDHRTNEYAQRVISLRTVFFSRLQQFILSQQGIPPDIANTVDPMFLAVMIRASYISSPEISESTRVRLDAALASVFGSGPGVNAGLSERIRQVFFSRDPNASTDFPSGIVRSGYLRFSVDRIVVRYIWREFVPE